MRRRSEAAGPDYQPAVKIPHDPFNEQVVIAAAIADENRAKWISRIRSDWFLGDGHPELVDAIQECERKKLSFDPATLRQLSGGKVDDEYVRTLVSKFDAPANLGHHIDALQWDYARADAVRGPIAAMLKALEDPTSDPARVRALAKQVAVSFDGYGDRKYMRDPAQLVREASAALAERRRKGACYPYGLDGLDKNEKGEWRMVPGAAPGQVTVITGVPGSAKSTVTARIALGLARKKRRILYGAWEMGAAETLELMACMSLGWSRTAVITGAVDDAQATLLEKREAQISAYVRFMSLPFGREPGKRYNNEAALDIVHGYVADSGCDVFIADLWKRMLRETRPDDEELALIRQQTIADETKVHCILVQQQRMKDIEMRHDKRPTREGIKGTGAWVEVGDTIIGAHLPSLWKRVPSDTIELGILKQRRGEWPLAIEFDWDPDLGLLENGRTIEWDPPGTARGDSELENWVGEEKDERRRAKAARRARD